MKHRRIVYTALVPLIAMTLAWLAGYDFDSRNFWIAYYSTFVVFITAMVWAVFSFGEDDE